MRFGHSFEKSNLAGIIAIDLPHSMPCHRRMAKLGPQQGIFARAWLAGLLAWLLALQGLVAALPQDHSTQPAAGHAITLKGEDCGAPRSPDPAAPCHHLPCACCILCFSGHGEGTLAVFGVIVFILAYSFRKSATTIAWCLTSTPVKPPPGWTSSWSQRAPPGIFSTTFAAASP